MNIIYVIDVLYVYVFEEILYTKRIWDAKDDFRKDCQQETKMIHNGGPEINAQSGVDSGPLRSGVYFRAIL